MTSKVENILEAVKTNLTGLTTTGTNVFRGRIYPLEDADLPALIIYMGPDRPLGDNGPNNWSIMDSDLSIRVSVHIKTIDEGLETLLNKIRSEVHTALMTDITQGLSYVMMTIPLGSDEPQHSGEGEKPTSVMDIDWVVRYRASPTSLEA